ncbi:MAG TPA: 3-dehydroquinate synthase [Myxococcales bacterium]|jgi:3-dehydroquinate synthase
MELTLRGKTGDCRIVLGDCPTHLPALCGQRRVVAVTDANVRRLHRAAFPQAEVIEIGLGEANKTLETVFGLYERFLELGLDRNALVVGIGGGIVCDVAAYAAATWLRGLDTGLVPTTVLAQADAGIGGKNGVNFRGLKNQVGTIRQPRFVLCDPAFLKTLPEAEVRNGFAEVVKAGAIADAALWDLLEAKAEAVLALEPDSLSRAMSAALAVKHRVVEADELETGLRRTLNFGHTVGHAWEALLGVRHGEAVSAGMVFAARLSEQRGRLAAGQADRLERLLQRFGLPTRLQADPDAVLEAVGSDKKRAGDSVHVVLLERIGRAVVEPVPLTELSRALSSCS